LRSAGKAVLQLLEDFLILRGPTVFHCFSNTIRSLDAWLCFSKVKKSEKNPVSFSTFKNTILQ